MSSPRASASARVISRAGRPGPSRSSASWDSPSRTSDDQLPRKDDDQLPRQDTAMTGSLKDQTVLVIGRGSGLARAVAVTALDAGARVIAAGRDREALSAAYA